MTHTKFDDLYNTIQTNINTDSSLLQQLETKLLIINSDASIQAMNSDASFCFIFSIKPKNHTDILKILNVSSHDVYDAFADMWGKAVMTNHMHSDIYYQTFLFCLYIGIQSKRQKLIDNAMFSILIKLWNGRKSKFIPFCKPKIMQYIVQYMTNKKHFINQYNSPYDLIINYFIPSLLKKYVPYINDDYSFGLKRIFEQGFSRIRQMFVSSNVTVNIKTGKKRSSGGILPLYKEAKKNNYSIDSITVYKNDDQDTSYSDYITTDNISDIITVTVDNIISDPNYKYSNMFIKGLNIDLKVSIKSIEQILINLHNPELNDILYDIYTVILNKLGIQTKTEICQSGFSQEVKTKILGSKNNFHSNKIKSDVTNLLEIIFKKINPEINIHTYSNLELIRLRKVIIRGLIYQLRNSICV